MGILQKNTVPQAIRTCEHDAVTKQPGAHLTCQCPCRKCFDGSRPLGERCIAKNHCSTHFLPDGKRRAE